MFLYQLEIINLIFYFLRQKLFQHLSLFERVAALPRQDENMLASHEVAHSKATQRFSHF